MTKTAGWLGVLLATCAVLLAACGTSAREEAEAKALTTAEYERRMTRIEREVEDINDDLQLVMDDQFGDAVASGDSEFMAETCSDVTDSLEQTSEDFLALAAQMRKLRPPVKVAKLHREYAEFSGDEVGYDEVVGAFDDICDAIDDEDEEAMSDASDELDDLLAGFDDEEDRFQKRFTKAGIDIEFAED